MPDPRRGVFETLLVLDGHPIELDAHLARLHAGLATLYPRLSPPPLDVPSLSRPYGRLSDGTSAGALRITVAPTGDEALAATVELRPAPSGGDIALHSLTVPGGLGTHKWADRSLLDAAQAELPAGALSLIVDRDGTALEASRANLFAARDKTLLTPPLDGRILPGITRMRVLELAADLGIETREGPLTTDDLLAADEVFLTGSVRGIERVGSLDGETLAARGEIAATLAAELRRLWLGAPVA